LTPLHNPEIYYWHHSIPAFDNGRFPSFDIGASILSNKYLVEDNSILVSKLNPSTSRIWTIFNARKNSICSTEIQVFIPDNYNYSFAFGLFHSRPVKKEMSQRATGTSSSHQRVRPSDILNIECIVPSKEILIKFNNGIFNLLKKTELNQVHINFLTQLRNILLPKLMSGTLKLNPN